MTADIITFAPRQQAKARPLHASQHLAVALSGEFHSRSLLTLPFVTLPLEECKDWGEFWKRASMWNDEPGDKGHEDISRGRRYAREAVAAIISDGVDSRGLEMVVEAILKRGFERRGPGGRLCRQSSSAEIGFLHELCRIAVEGLRREGDEGRQA